MDEIIDVLNDFMEHDNGDVDVDKRAMASAQYFDDLFTKIETELYQGCTKFSSLNFSMKLMDLNVSNKWTNKSFDSLLKLLKNVLPERNKLLVSYKKKMKKLGVTSPIFGRSL